MSTPPDDAQRELEQRALRNVRGLVDHMEASEHSERRTQKRLVVAILAGAVLSAALVAGLLALRSRSGTTVTLEPAKAPPARTAPAK